MAKFRRVSNGRHPAQVIFGHSLFTVIDKVRASGQRLRCIDRFEADKPKIIFLVHLRTFGQPITDAVLFLRHHLTEAKVVRSSLASQLVPCGVTLFDTHDTKRLGPVRSGVKFFASLHKFRHHRLAVAGWNRDLKRQLA